MMRFFPEKAGLEFTLSHLVRLYQPFHHRGMLTLRCCSSTPFVVDDEKDGDQERVSLFVRIRTVDIIPVELMLFPRGWNYAREWSVLCFLRFAYSENKLSNCVSFLFAAASWTPSEVLDLPD